MTRPRGTRRRFLTFASATGIATIAGCIGGSDEGSTETAMDDEMTDGEMTEDEMTDDGMTEEEMTDDETTGEEMTEEETMAEPTDPAEAPRAEVDRFSEAAGTLMVRDDGNDLPGPDEPIDFDRGPFITRGLGPDGGPIEYYNFDVQPTEPAPIYALFREGEDEPVEDQLNVVGVIPGDEGYNDLWHVHKVTVPEEYVANTVTNVADIQEAGYDVEATGTVKNCPVVPDGSSASKRFGDGDAGLVEGWYDGQVVSYFLFEEAPLELADGAVPLSPIYVSFNRNPGEDGGGPPSGFMIEEGSDQTHNVTATLPSDADYSPLWQVNVYDNADFADVSDLDSATDAEILATGAATVNCPIVSAE